MKLKYKKLVSKAIVIGCLLVIIGLLTVIKTLPGASEYFFARGVSKGYSFVMGHIAEIFPFSLFDLFVTAAILALVGCVVALIYYLKKRKKTQAVALSERMIVAVLCVIVLYQITASGNYARDPLPLKKYEGEQLSAEETGELVETLLDDFATVSSHMIRDENGCTPCPYDFETVSDLIRAEYDKLDDGYFRSYTPTVKEGWYSGFLTAEGITGITFCPTGDAVVNGQTPDCYKTVTAAHELAHTVGVMRESDANLTAYYILLRSENEYFRYCAYMYSLSYLTQLLYIQDKDIYREVMQKYPKEALKERQAESDFWAEHESIMEEIGEFVNDLYLKASGSKEGTASYSDPSTVTEVQQKDDKPPVVVIEYSDTARVLIQIATEKQ